jgi:predicted NACHT family NTPase
MNYEEVIEKAVIGKLVGKSIDQVSKLFNDFSKEILDKAKKRLKKEEFEKFEKDYDLEVSEKIVLKMIAQNLKSTSIWSSEVDFSAALNSKLLKKVFVDLDLYLSPLKNRFDDQENTKRIKRTQLLNDFTKNKIIYGGAGAGKTTLIKKVCSELLENLDFDKFSCPIVIRFREVDYADRNSGSYFGLYNILTQVLGIRIQFPDNQLDSFEFEYRNLLKQTILTFLEENKILLIADGFDEIPSIELKKQIEKEFHQLAVSLKDARFIVTSRNNDFVLKLPNTNNYEICPLNDNQIKSIIKKWLVNQKKADDLYDKIRNSPYYDTTMRPLTLAHLCAIYERRNTIPPKPRYIYDFVLNLLLEIWDQQRSIVRPSNYADFYIEKKKEFLAHLSFFFSFHLAKNVFTSDQIRLCYNKIYKSHNLPPSQAKKVVTELENHTGLLVQIGYNSYQFSHKSLQEFLTAKHINSMPKIPEFDVISELPNEIAIAACLSSSPNFYFERFIRDFNKYNDHFWNVFLNRLIDESPDFNEDPAVIVFFLIASYDSNNPIFVESFKELLVKTNLDITVKPFLRVYSRGQINDSSVGYSHRNIKIPLKQRNYFPSRLIAEGEMAHLIIS